VAPVIGALDCKLCYSSWDLQTALAVQALSSCIGSDMVLSALTALESDNEQYSAIASGFGVQCTSSISGRNTFEVCTTCKMVCGLRTLCLHCGTRRAFYTQRGPPGMRGILTCSKQLITPRMQVHNKLSCLEQMECQRCHAISASQQCPQG